MVVIVASFVILSVLFLVLSIRAERRIKNIPLTKQSHYPLISIIIPAYRTKKFENTLKAVKSSTYPNKEIIVVNDEFESQIKGICKKFGAKLIQNQKRVGKALALNMGVKHAKGDYLLFLDSDTLVNKNTLTTLFNSYKSYEERGDKIGMISPAYTSINKKNIFSRVVNFEQILHQNIIKIQMNFKTIMSIRGCCLMLSKNVFLKTGGFSKTIMEDGDIAAKVLEAGYNIKYEPRATVKTMEPETFTGLMKSKRRYGKGTFYTLLNHKKPYLTSIQTAICFYPAAILVLAFIGFYLFQNFVYTVPLLLFLTTISVNGTFSFFYTAIAIIGVSAASSLINGVFTYHPASSMGLVTQLITVGAFGVLFIPMMYGYLRGGFAGISDKLNKRPELIFDDW